jgi:hypothetical protein
MKVVHVSRALLLPTFLLLACQESDGPALSDGTSGKQDPVHGCAPDWDETGETGDTGAEETGEPTSYGQSYRCQGVGNGWAEVDLDIATVIACVNQPESLSTTEQLAVTVTDCKNQPLDLQNLPDWDGIIEPAACCGDLAEPDDIVNACVTDCGWAACKLAIGSLRQAASSIEYGVLGGDLAEFASYLEMPGSLEECAGTVSAADGEFAAVDLGEASSNPAEIGHVNNLTLRIQCDLDDQQPTVLDEESGVCTQATNIPPPSEESNNGGIFTQATVTAFSPAGEDSVDLPRVGFEFEEQLCDQSTCGFTLTRLDGTLSFVELGDYTFENVSYSLRVPAHGVIAGQSITFPAGSVRLDVSADAMLAGQSIWRVASGSFEVHNTSLAVAERTSSGFAFTDLEFAVGDEALVFTTESAPFVSVPR